MRIGSSAQSSRAGVSLLFSADYVASSART